MSGAIPHHERLDAELKRLGELMERIKLTRSQAAARIPREISDAYEELNRRMDEATDRLDSLKTAGPAASEDLARALDGVMVELKATAEVVLARVNAAAEIPQ